jgi:predicted peptidase
MNTLGSFFWSEVVFCGMKRMLYFIVLVLVWPLVAGAEMRTWTASDGRSLEAEFLSATDKAVTLRRKADGKRFTLPLDKISEEDRAWVTEKQAEMRGPEPKEPSGIFADRLTDEWEKMEYKSLKFRFYGGKKLKAKERYPVVIFLHGKGSGGDDNEKQLQAGATNFAKDDFYKKNPSFIIAPQCPDDSKGWNGEYLDDVISLIEEMLKDLPTDKNRVYITGLSMGGFGTWKALAHSPKLFAAAVPVCGGGNPSTAKDIKDIPIWVHHGAADPAVSVEGSRKMVEALKEVRGNVRYTEYDEASGIQHNAWDPCYKNEEVFEWIFAQSRDKKKMEENLP